MNLQHLEQQFKDNGISGMVFVNLTDVRLQCNRPNTGLRSQTNNSKCRKS